MTKLAFSRYQLGVLKDMVRAVDSLSLHCSLLLKTVDEHTVEVCDSYCGGSCYCAATNAPCGHCENSHGYNREGNKPGKDDYRWER